MVTDGGEPAVASLRLRVESGEITEGEWHMAHKGDPGISGVGSDVLFDVDKLIASPPPQRVVAPAERQPRDALVRIVNSYFDGLAAGNGRSVIAHGGCSRFENGFEVTGRPIRSGDLTDGFEGRGDCTSGYASLAVALVAARRYLLIDEEAQVVVMSAIFIRKPGDARRRNHFMEVFGIDGGKIRTVHAAMFYAAPDLPLPNWPPYEGNFPLVANPQPTQLTASHATPVVHQQHAVVARERPQAEAACSARSTAMLVGSETVTRRVAPARTAFSTIS